MTNTRTLRRWLFSAALAAQAFTPAPPATEGRDVAAGVVVASRETPASPFAFVFSNEPLRALFTLVAPSQRDGQPADLPLPSRRETWSERVSVVLEQQVGDEWSTSWVTRLDDAAIGCAFRAHSPPPSTHGARSVTWYAQVPAEWTLSLEPTFYRLRMTYRTPPGSMPRDVTAVSARFCIRRPSTPHERAHAALARAALWQARGQLERARVAYRAAIIHAPEVSDFCAYSGLAETCDALGLVDEALDAVRAYRAHAGPPIHLGGRGHRAAALEKRLLAR